MKQYTSPQIEIVEIEAQDVITASRSFEIKEEAVFDGVIEWK